MPRGDSVALQCTLVGNSLNDEQWADGLSNQIRHHITYPKIGIAGKHEPESEKGFVGGNPQRSSRRHHTVSCTE